jgi:hypothetical protein
MYEIVILNLKNRLVKIVLTTKHALLVTKIFRILFY